MKGKELKVEMTVRESNGTKIDSDVFMSELSEWAKIRGYRVVVFITAEKG